MEEQEKLKHLITGLAILVPTMFLLGIMGTWFFMDLRVKNIQNELEKIRTEIKQVEEDTIIEKEKNDKINNVINYDTLKVGDEIGAFTVKSIQPLVQSEKVSKNNLLISFTGNAEISGKYNYYDLNYDFAIMAGVIILEVNPNDLNIFPRLNSDPISHITFVPSEESREKFGLNDNSPSISGEATVIIKEFIVAYAEIGGYAPYMAKIEKVINNSSN
jgi:hypothetical protein